MIQIEDIHIREFRGIRDLSLNLGSKSFVVYGPNGSGKSGVVDAIDFALTGNISRLAGAGSGGLSVLKHGPHVHRRDDPGVSQVSMTVRCTASGKSAVLTRCVKTARQYTLQPDFEEVRAAVEKAQQHGELTLSRREIIKFVLAEPGKRSQEVQALLKLDRIGEIRGVLRTAQTKTRTEEKVALGQVTTAGDALRRHLDLPRLLEGEVILVINRHRDVLGLPPIDRVDDDTDVRRDVDTDSSLSAFNRASAVRDVETLQAFITDPADFMTVVDRLSAALDELDADPGILSSLNTHELVAAGLGLVTESRCPLCDVEWPSIDTLRLHLADKLTQLNEATRLRDRIRTAAQAVAAASQAIRGIVRTVISVAAADDPNGLHLRLQRWSEDLISFETDLESIAGTVNQRARLANDPLRLPGDVVSGLVALLETVKAKPDQSAPAHARTFLIVAQERMTAQRLARAELRKKSSAWATAKAAYEIYCTESDAALTELYHKVEYEFSTFYRQINADDESGFKAQLEPSSGKLDLAVDFHGIGMFPPAAYHSEGHQDGMGVCLYLALIKQLLGTDFRLAVLDDVVMSVDSNHRKQFCNLLIGHFPDVQFIITTHDEVWARQMQSSGLIGKAAQARFLGWTVDDGPAYEQGRDLWDRIDADLANNDVPAAAARLRRNLESIMTELAGSLRGQVAYRVNGNYDLGELLAAVKGKYGKLLGQAAKSANSWGDESTKARVEELKALKTKATLAQEGENWAINPAVHFNEWASFSRADFLPVLAAWKQFLALFTCENSNCETRFYVVGNVGNEEALRCPCGRLNLNLRSK